MGFGVFTLLSLELRAARVALENVELAGVGVMEDIAAASAAVACAGNAQSRIHEATMGVAKRHRHCWGRVRCGCLDCWALHGDVSVGW